MVEIPGYTLERVLGRGGMGEVHLARQVSLDRAVAIKLLPAATAADPVACERFLREARIAAGLQHPNIVAIHDVGIAAGVPYIAMDYVGGGTVALRPGESLAADDALAIVRQVALALDHAHAGGVVHRDVKPENLLRRADGTILLSDFGIARARGQGTLLTRAGDCIGTPSYMSPEQLRGQDLDGRSDLYSLGVTLFRLLVGRLPFEADDDWTIGLQHVCEPVPRLPARLAALQPLLDDLLAKERQSRPASGRVLAERIDTLRSAIAGSPQEAAIPRDLATTRPSPVPVDAGPANSIAVLPFEDLSRGHDHAYVAEGIAEEIRAALARVPGLRVAGRTSSAWFRGREASARQIGSTLGVATLLEGSVRAEEGQVRVTVELVQAADGFQRWSASFDGDLTRLFELQERIARATAARFDLAVPNAAAAAAAAATTSADAYLLYLQAGAIFHRRDGAQALAGVALLEQALALDPGYARAHARIAALYLLAAEYGTHDAARSVAAADRHARRAIELDPGFAEPLAVLGHLHRQQRRYLDERAAFERALALEPDDPNALHLMAMSLLFTGYRRAAMALLDRVLAVDPILPIALLWRGTGHATDGNFELAERMLRRANAFGLLPIGFGMAWVEEMRGQKGRALGHLTAGLRVFTSSFPPGTAETLAAACLGEADARQRALAAIDAYLANPPAVISAVIPWTLFRIGEPALALEVLARGPTSNDGLAFGVLFSRIGRAARDLPQFSEFVRDTGLAELWRQHGAPDFVDTD